MILVLFYIGLLVFMVCVLMAPVTVNDIMRWRIRAGARSSPPHFPYIPVIVIFFAGIGLFNEIGFKWPAKTLPYFDLFQFYAALFSVIWLAITGVIACFWPMQIMRIFIQPLRKVQESAVDSRAKTKIVLVAKAFGVIFLLASSFVVHQLAIAN
jgi:hypothetical protein